jgi:hypothetical protein
MKKKAAVKKHHRKPKARKQLGRPGAAKPQKVLIVFNTQRNFWMAVPGITILSALDAIEWKALGANKFEFDPDEAIFENIRQGPGHKVSATVKDGVSGYFPTPMTADDDDVEGGSSPSVIID